MDVYVESNFVLELALQQEGHKSCRDIVDLCQRSSIGLVIPAFCLPEAYYALIGKRKQRDGLISAFATEQGQLLRSERYKGRSEQLEAVRSMLIASIAHDSEDFRACLTIILETARVIPLDKGILKSATTLEQGMDVQLPDSIVLASVIADQETQPRVRVASSTKTRKTSMTPTL